MSSLNQKSDRVSDADCSPDGDTWGKRSLWVFAIGISFGLGFFCPWIPSVLRWYFLFTGFFSYPLNMMHTLNKDDYIKGVRKFDSEHFQALFSCMFFIAVLVVKVMNHRENGYVWHSLAIFFVFSYFPYWLKKKILQENVFYQLPRLGTKDVDSFIEKNSSLIAQKPYLFFYEAIIVGQMDLATKIYSSNKLSLSIVVHISGTGASQPETISNLLIHFFYQQKSPRWENVFRYLEPLGIEVGSRTVEIVNETETGIKWVDKLIKEDNPNRLAFREFVKNKRNVYVKVACTECDGAGKYFEHHDDDGDPSCPYCGGRGFYEKVG